MYFSQQCPIIHATAKEHASSKRTLTTKCTYVNSTMQWHAMWISRRSLCAHMSPLYVLTIQCCCTYLHCDVWKGTLLDLQQQCTARSAYVDSALWSVSLIVVCVCRNFNSSFFSFVLSIIKLYIFWIHHRT